VLDAVVDHDIGTPDFLWCEVDGANILVVSSDPLEPCVSPLHDKPDMRVQSARLGVHIEMQGHDVDPHRNSPVRNLASWPGVGAIVLQNILDYLICHSVHISSTTLCQNQDQAGEEHPTHCEQ